MAARLDSQGRGELPQRLQGAFVTLSDDGEPAVRGPLQHEGRGLQEHVVGLRRADVADGTDQDLVR